MKKAFALSIIGVFVLSLVSVFAFAATDASTASLDSRNWDLDQICKDHGFDHSGGMFDRDNNDNWFKHDDNNRDNIDFGGNGHSFDWSSRDNGEDGVLSFEDNQFNVLNGGFSGHHECDKDKKIDHVLFCHKDKDHDVPEFGVIAGAIALVGAIAGFVLIRKKN